MCVCVCCQAYSGHSAPNTTHGAQYYVHVVTVSEINKMLRPKGLYNTLLAKRVVTYL